MTSEGKRQKANLQRVHGFVGKVIEEKKAKMFTHDELKKKVANAEDVDCHLVKRKAFLEFLLKYHFNDPSFTEQHVKEEVNTFMFAGQDSSGMGLSYLLYCIGLYPKVQEKIVKELNEIFENDDVKEVTLKDLKKMKYLECVIKETFRLFPPVPFFARECNETFDVLGHKVHRGSLCFIFSYALHRDRESFPDPEIFIPERFLPENSIGRHPYAYIPFSAGPRICIGQKFAMMELKTVLANVLRRLRVTSLDPIDRVHVVPNMILRNTMPLRLRFENR
ncbi:unnamed protein product [Larinioides sclopetarius]|uniref:Cytochrome P450 n=1 Tax=Larinioides sclopetarius TaxID=280406 RepID=A0AAV2C001_9ARAC